MLLVPKVAIKGTIPSTVMTNALNAPNAIPMPRARIMAMGTGIPAFMADATTRPEKATPEPTDRSIQPLAMMYVSAMATMTATDVCVAMLSRFLCVRKLFVVTEKNIHNIKSPIIVKIICVFIFFF